MSILMTEYDYATDMAVLREESYEDGWEEGAYQNKLETARNLLAMGLSPEQISQATKLPPETISHLAPAEGR